MYGPKPEDVFYYITLHNENYTQPARPEGLTDEAILRGIYRLRRGPGRSGRDAHPARLVGSGSILEQVIAARDLLAEQFGVAAEVYSAPSFPLLRREALEAERWNRLHPDAKTPRVPVVDAGAAARRRADRRRDRLAEGAARHGRPLAAGDYVSLGTDGFGRSGTREDLRALFEIDPPHIAAATMVALARCGALAAGQGREGDPRARHRS